MAVRSQSVNNLTKKRGTRRMVGSFGDYEARFTSAPPPAAPEERAHTTPETVDDACLPIMPTCRDAQSANLAVSNHPSPTPAKSYLDLKATELDLNEDLRTINEQIQKHAKTKTARLTALSEKIDTELEEKHEEAKNEQRKKHVREVEALRAKQKIETETLEQEQIAENKARKEENLQCKAKLDDEKQALEERRRVKLSEKERLGLKRRRDSYTIEELRGMVDDYATAALEHKRIEASHNETRR